MSDLNLWHKRLKAKHDAGTLEDIQEAQLLAILDIRNNLIHQSKALNELIDSQGTVEGVVTSVDRLLATTYGPAYPGHHRGAISNGRAPASGHDVAGALSEGGPDAV